MGRIDRGTILWTLLLCAACGSGDRGAGSGGGDGGGSGQSADSLRLLSHEPAVDALQIATTTPVVLRFDAPVIQVSLQEPETRLVPAAGGDPLPGAWRFTDGGRTATFTPATPLERETDYRFELSPLTADPYGRILDELRSFTFRTIDESPPVVVRSSIPSGALGVDRTAAIVVTFDGALGAASADPAHAVLLDRFGVEHALALTVRGAELDLKPVADLPGSLQFTLHLRRNGVRDRAGNALAATWKLPFTTAADPTPPRLLSLWPDLGIGVSPRIVPVLRFDESIDPASMDGGALSLADEHGNMIHCVAELTPDGRELRFAPQELLVSGRNYQLSIHGGPGAVTDRSGNALASSQTLTLIPGVDAAPPVVTQAFPRDGDVGIALHTDLQVTFDEPLEAARVHAGTVQLTVDGLPIAGTLTLAAPDRIRIVPAARLAPGRRHELRLLGGHDGLRDPAGNLLPADVVIRFTTADDVTLPTALLAPSEGSAAVSPDARLTAVFDSILDPLTVTADSVQLRAGNVPVPGDLSLLRGGRVVQFVPQQPLAPGYTYTWSMRAGPDGVREQSGNWLERDLTTTFRVGHEYDRLPPFVAATLNGIADQRKRSQTLPPDGFTIDVRANDTVHYAVDLASVEVVLRGASPTPDPDALFALASCTPGRLSVRLPASLALANGDYELEVRLRDLSGNQASSGPLPFRVAPFAPEVQPFERLQVVWVRFDMDRDSNGKPDFTDDLLRLGLIAEGDPIGRNARVEAIVRDGLLAAAHELYGRTPDGRSASAGAVRIRLTHRRPLGVPHMQIAVGGLDPEGARNRTLGAESTGILGRAWYDYRNSSVTDTNVGTRPGLGVFPGELLLFQAKLHFQVYPSYTTVWARAFLPLAPALQGTPAGRHPLDATVLAPGFDFDNAGAEQRARYLAVFGAADDWAVANGVILAHEIGHSLGLTAPGPNPLGLHGDDSLHNEASELSDVMAPSVSYEALVSLPYAFRDLNLAYLRQRLLLR